MQKTIPADYLGRQSLGYVLLALPSESFKNQVNQLLTALNAELPGVIWPMPPEQLHITLCEIIQPKDYSQDKESMFSLHRKQYENAPAEILSKLQKFSVTFNVIEASPPAIIIRASDSSAFNAIRAKLVEAMQLPTETRTPPAITHSTVARYLKVVELEEIQKTATKHSLEIEEEITEFKLIRTTIPPLQKYVVLKHFPLATN